MRAREQALSLPKIQFDCNAFVSALPAGILFGSVEKWTARHSTTSSSVRECVPHTAHSTHGPAVSMLPIAPSIDASVVVWAEDSLRDISQARTAAIPTHLSLSMWINDHSSSKYEQPSKHSHISPNYCTAKHIFSYTFSSTAI